MTPTPDLLRVALGAVVDRWYRLGLIRFNSRDDGGDDLLLRDELWRAALAAQPTLSLSDEQWNEAYRAGRAAGITEMVDAQPTPPPLGVDAAEAALRSVAHDARGCNGLHVELEEGIRALATALTEPKP
jgi:hypothetical protein